LLLGLSGCGVWCELRGGDYEMRLPPDEEETRTCVMPEDPAADAGKHCTDSGQCEKGCLCPDEVTRRLSEQAETGEDLREINESKLPVTGGTCAELRHDVGFTCHVVEGKAVVDMVLI